jgi:hypothetical protein
MHFFREFDSRTARADRDTADLDGDERKSLTNNEYCALVGLSARFRTIPKRECLDLSEIEE